MTKNRETFWREFRKFNVMIYACNCLVERKLEKLNRIMQLKQNFRNIENTSKILVDSEESNL